MDTVRARLLLVVGLGLLLGACQRIDVGQVGNGGGGYGRGGEEEDDDDGSPEHRPGQRCFDCHSEESHRGGPTFVLAGTIYARASDVVGAGGAIVHVVDAAGHDFRVGTYDGGNFMVGRDDIPWTLVYPLESEVALPDGATRAMRALQRKKEEADKKASSGIGKFFKR